MLVRVVDVDTFKSALQRLFAANDGVAGEIMLSMLDLSLSMLLVSNLAIFRIAVILAFLWGSVQFVTLLASICDLVWANAEDL